MKAIYLTSHQRLTRPGQCSSSIRRSRLLDVRCKSSMYKDMIAVSTLLDDIDDSSLSIEPWAWQGSDKFTELDDRKDAPPLPLPKLEGPKTRVVLVRHGQSTWNARNRVQGSSDFAILTEEGIEQAAVAARLLSDVEFDASYVSPLQRASQTATVVWGSRSGPITYLPSLREIDLYSFQGLEKAQGRTKYGDAYDAWQRSPHTFEIDGHAPVRELWYRASLAWQDILAPSNSGSTILVVAHNAVNQALIGTALGLEPVHFRRLAQSNAAFSVLDFDWSSSKNTPLTVERLNQFPDAPLRKDKLGKTAIDRLVLISGSRVDSPTVQKGLKMLRECGVEAPPPMVSVGTPEQQASDVLTAVQATIATPGEGRMVLAVAAPEACSIVLSECLGVKETSRVWGMRDGGISIVNYKGVSNLNKGVLLCSNYNPDAV